MSNPSRVSWGYNICALICLVSMYGAYELWGVNNSNLFSLAVAILGAFVGFLFSKSSTIKSEYQMERILGSALIREKEQEVKTVEEAKKLYQEELQRLKEIIEAEGNRLLLHRLREVYIEDIREKFQEINAIDGKLTKIDREVQTLEILEMRKQLERLLAGVRNPEEEERLIKHICYTLPMGNLLYLIYLVAKKISPNLKEKVHSHIYRIKNVEFMVGVFFIIIILIVFFCIVALGIISKSA